MQAISTRQSKDGGFTIVELLVVITVMGILIGLVLASLGGLYQSNNDSLTQTVQSTDTRSVLRTIENDLTNTSSFLTTTSMTPANPTGANDIDQAWDYKGNDPAKPQNRVLIASLYATTKPSTDNTRSLVYMSGSGCDPATATPVQYNYVYFVKQDATGQYNLYRRTMMPSDAQCGAPLGPAIQKQTCAASKVAGNANCVGSDAVLLYNVDNFTVDYYSDSITNDPYPNQYAATPDNIALAKSIKVKVKTIRRVNGSPQPFESEIRISRLN